MKTPDYYHHACECVLVLFIGVIVWPAYLLRPRDYFRDMKKAFIRADKEFLQPPTG